MAANTYVDGGWGDDGASFVTLAKAGGRKGNILTAKTAFYYMYFYRSTPAY